VRKLYFIWVGLCVWTLLAGISRADTFELSDGRTVSGEVIAGSADDVGVQIKVEDNRYERVPWGSFSQDDLKRFARDDRNPKMARFAQGFVEVSPADRKKSDLQINQPPRLQRPAPRSLPGALFSSGLGVLLLLLVYAANVYAAYEISIFRSRPAALVCGVSAVAPVIGPAIFLALPAPVTAMEEDPLQPQGPAVIQPFASPGSRMAAGAAAPPEGGSDPSKSSGGIRIAQPEAPAAAGVMPAQIFKRGAFTFNRRFFETRFSGFFGMVRREADKGMVLEIQSARGEYNVHRISRIASNELHVQVQKGSASEEVMIPFSEIQEVRLKSGTA